MKCDCFLNNNDQNLNIDDKRMTYDDIWWNETCWVAAPAADPGRMYLRSWLCSPQGEAKKIGLQKNKNSINQSYISSPHVIKTNPRPIKIIYSEPSNFHGKKSHQLDGHKRIFF